MYVIIHIGNRDNGYVRITGIRYVPQKSYSIISILIFICLLFLKLNHIAIFMPNASKAATSSNINMAWMAPVTLYNRYMVYNYTRKECKSSAHLFYGIDRHADIK
uniref:Uncharacterized protein n=1 Tax=Cacopsylla melanoneura TaxID=428564 RepID=A0A8D8VSP0_9HEMI